MSTTTLSATLLLTITLISVSLSSTTAILSAYDILKSYDFPVGLIPVGVTGYEFNRDTGDFKLYFPKTCKFHIDSYELEYKSTISGKLVNDRLYSLKGVSVKVLFLWVNIVEVRKEDDELQFSVGIASANFPLDGFEESPQCGCGFDCVEEVEISHGADQLVSAS